jgi:hypothetical protein
MDISVGPTLTAFIESDPDGVVAQLVELRLPFVPRVGERLNWGIQEKRTSAEFYEVSLVMGEPDENDIVRVRHVNIWAGPIVSSDEEA